MSHVFSLVNTFAAAWADAGARACWQGGLVILLVWSVCRLWPALPPGPRCWLWRLAYAKLLLGLVWLPPLALPLLPRLAAPPPPPAQAFVMQEQPAPAPPATADPSPPETMAAAPPPSVPLPAPPAVVAPRPAPLILPTLQALLLTAWLLGTLAGLTRVASAWRRALTLSRASAPITDDALHADAAALCRRLGLRRVPPLRAAGGIPSPLLLGLGRPAVLLPAFVLSSSPRAEVKLMLAHELAHLARRDLLWDIMPQLAQRLFFFHPLVWLAGHEWALAQEIACDALAVQATGAPPSAYGRMLLGIATRRRDPAAPLFPTLAVAAPRHTLRRRIFAMQHLGTSSRPRLILAAALTTALAIGWLLPWRVVAQSRTPSAAPPVAAHAEAVREKNIQAERADIASKNTQLDAQVAGFLKTLSPAQLKAVQPNINSMNTLYAEEQHRAQLLERDRASYVAAHPNRLSDEQLASVRHFNWFQWKPDRIGRGIRREQVVRRKLRTELAFAQDTRTRQDLQQQIAAIDQRRREGETQIRQWEPIINRDRRRVAVLPAEQRTRVTKLDSYDLNIIVDEEVALTAKQYWVQRIRQKLAGYLSPTHQSHGSEIKASLAPPQSRTSSLGAVTGGGPPPPRLAQSVRDTTAAQPNPVPPARVQVSPVMAEALDKEIAQLEKQQRAWEQQASGLAEPPVKTPDERRAASLRLKHLSAQISDLTRSADRGEIAKARLRAQLAEAKSAPLRQAIQAQIAAIDAQRPARKVRLAALGLAQGREVEYITPGGKKAMLNGWAAQQTPVIAYLKARRAGEAWAQASIASPEFSPRMNAQQLASLRHFEQQAQHIAPFADMYVYQLATIVTIQQRLHRLHRSTASHGFLHGLYVSPIKGHRVQFFTQDASGQHLILDKVSDGKLMVSPPVLVKPGEKVEFVGYDNGKMMRVMMPVMNRTKVRDARAKVAGP